MSSPQSIAAATLDYIEERWFKMAGVQHIQESDGNWLMERQQLESYLLIVIAEGQGQLIVDSASSLVTSEEVWICRPGQWMEANIYAFNKTGFYVITFDIGMATHLSKEGSAEQTADFPVIGSASLSASEVMPLCQVICQHWFGENKLQRLRSQGAFHELLCCVLQKQVPLQLNSLTAMIEKAKGYIDEHCRENISFEKLAQEAGISSRHFRRLFKNLYGKSAVDYLTELRMNHARELMRRPDVPLWEVAQHVGYHDESHFRRAFKSHIGISPALYVKNHQLKIAAYSWPNIGMLLPLQVIPFAAPIDHYWTDYYRSKYGFDVKVRLRHDYDFNRKSLLVSCPDRIIAIDEFLPAREQEMLGHIAPVLFIPWKSKDWREHLLMVAAFLEKRQEAETWLSNYDDNQVLISEQVRRLVQREKLLVIMIDRKNMYRWGKGYEGTVMFHQLPLSPARHLDSLDASYELIDPQQAAAFDADRILMLISEDGASQGTLQTVNSSEEWQNMRAYKEKRVSLIQMGPWYEYSAYNHDLIQKQVIHLLGSIRT
ncbi:helix-turn-helix domain-containing protein [Paenibacillus oryzisoli]|uniref:AraC family transcriptional regulator n=1 Tax=Paenibacillus oryzisoli TaxID=1850517 RepID=A0A198AI61_9BACL|nr:AraC family transcriptional regulator [Paenibacillus oryzisoli]OAS20721.1 hypothetical protein A8708_19500 [Paenibacillus oryzisoli]